MTNGQQKKRWYAIHTYTGYEEKVIESIKRQVASDRKQDEISEMLIPTEKVAEIKGSRRQIATKKMFPGYIVINMVMTEENWSMIKNMPGVTSFVGPARTPTPLTEEEVQNIKQHMEESAEAPRPKITFGTGERVKVIDGPFLNFSGLVDHINEERGRLVVMVDILGRSTPVELDFLQVEKIAN